MLDFRILGELEVDRDGARVELQGQRARAALVLLLLEGNRVVSTERLVDALWGEDPPKTAAAALRNVVSQLRRALGDDAIETRAPGYVLRVAKGSFDLDRFEGALAGAGRAEPGERARLLRAALAEWRGPPLPELAYESSLQTEIRRLEELRVAAEEELVEAELEHGNAARLVPQVEALASRHPHRERLAGLRMRALYAAGRQADALAAYQDVRRRLAADLGLEPGPELRRLHGAILRQEAAIEDRRRGDGGAADAYLQDVADALLAGRLVVVASTSPDHAPALAERFAYPAGHVVETPRVAQYVAAVRGVGPLHDGLRELAAANGEPSRLHRFLASLPPLLRELGLPHQLLVTTDYDGTLERAFAEAAEEVDVVSYLATGPHRGRFCHVSPGGGARVIESPGDYATELSLERRTVVLRLRGRVDASPTREHESFVVTEDDHLDYLRSADVAGGIPIGIAATLRRSHFLFAGYAVGDWCLRVVLDRVCAEGPLAYRSWAVAEGAGPADGELWRRLGVDFVRGDPGAYAVALDTVVRSGTAVTA
ncbi:MAG TPA: BTAD domain-containing putative transcriptional regulator [Gaiellaceae bacterium]|nr:BTAD domain-containing putative transcriptional regulator [Gaiellaceae bacterium]